MKRLIVILSALIVLIFLVERVDAVKPTPPTDTNSSNIVITDTQYGSNVDALDNNRILVEDTIRLQGDSQVLQIRNTTSTDKAIIAFLDENYKTTAYIVTHDYLTPTERHRHFEVETVKSDMQTRVGRFNITYGEDLAEITFPNSEVLIKPNNLKIRDELGGEWYINASSSGELYLTKYGKTIYSIK